MRTGEYFMSIADFIKENIGGPLTTSDIERELKNPYSLVNQFAGSFVAQISTKNFIEEIQRIISHLIGHTKEKSESSYSSQELDPSDEEENTIPEESTTSTTATHDLQKRLDREVSILNTLYQQRNDLIKPMVTEWRKQQENQVNDLADTLKTKGFMELTPADKKVLGDVAKGQQIQITHPELIPAETKPEQVTVKANVALELALFRVLLSENFKPSEIIKLRPKVTLVITSHFSNTLKEDKELAEKQAADYFKLKEVNTKIEHSVDEIKNIQLKAQQLAAPIENPEEKPKQATSPFNTTLRPRGL
jgi:hypothetical protein